MREQLQCCAWPACSELARKFDLYVELTVGSSPRVSHTQRVVPHTGIGGDCFCLFYDAKTNEVHGMNASGRTPKALSIDVLRKQVRGRVGGLCAPANAYAALIGTSKAMSINVIH
jgi:hypothetical protein